MLQTSIRFFMAFPNVSGFDEGDLVSPHLRAAIAHFRQVYPSGIIITEWVAVYAEQCVVRAVVQMGTVPLGSAMAMGKTVEQAEDQAKLRAIAVVLPSQAKTPGTAESWASPPLSTSQSWQSPESHQPPTSSMNWVSGDRPLAAPSPLEPPPSPFPVPGDGLGTEVSTKPSSTADLHAPDLSHSQPPSEVGLLADLEHASASMSSTQLSDLPESSSAPDADQTKASKASVKSQASTSRSAKKPSKKKAPPSASTSTTGEPTIDPPPPQQENAPGTMAVNVDLSDIIAKTSVELRRLGWTDVQGREHLEKVYGKRSRQQLTDPELLDFLSYLESQPTPP